MHNIVSFACPRCGAPVQVAEGQFSVQCEYCGGTIVVPPELRPAPPPPPPPPPHNPTINVVVNPPLSADWLPPRQPVEPYVQPQARRRGGGCVSMFVALLAMGLITIGVLWYINSRVPYFFDNLIAGGFARIEQTFSAQADGTDLINDPIDLAVDGKNNIYVVDGNRNLVVRFDEEGTYRNSWRLDSKDKRVEAMVADKAGSVFVTMGGGISKYEANTGTLVGTGGIADIFGIGDICVLPDGSLMGYASSTADSLVHFDANIVELGRIARPISEVTGENAPVIWQLRMAAGKDGTLYLLSTDLSKQVVYVYGSDGKYKTRFGSQGDGEGQFNSAGAIAVDSKGRIYISDWKGVQAFDQKGKYIGIIRLPYRGVATGMAFNSRNELYLVSRGQKKVYKFVLNEP